MITAIDSSVVLDLFEAEAPFGPHSREAMRAARKAGAILAVAAVWAEVRAHFDSDEHHAVAMEDLGIEFSPPLLATAARAGAMWREYRRAGGQRSRVTTDFLIGAHALLQADCLLTRDRGFYRTYFSSLRLLTPEID
ncbi:MAG: PIN domain-containing protein [Acidobacteria bacterium]|nr:MAG: PIN domain-containing protein [Acidobacteriota bacterium]